MSQRMSHRLRSWGSTIMYLFNLISIDLESNRSFNLSSTIGYCYFAPYYPMTYHPCSTPVFSFNCTSVQPLLYTSSAAMVYCRHHLFGHPFHIYIEGLVPYRINKVLILLVRFNRREGGAAR